MAKPTTALLGTDDFKLHIEDKMKLKQFESALYDLFDRHILEKHNTEHGYNNIQEKKFSKIGFSTNLTPDIIHSAKEYSVDFIITHHDAWDFLPKLRDESLQLLTDFEITHYFSHLPLDYAEFGTSSELAKELKIISEGRFAECEGLTCGVYGTLIQSTKMIKFVSLVSSTLDEKVLSWNNCDSVNKVGVATGAGNLTELLEEAKDLGCDTYITGEKNLYIIQYAEYLGLNLIVGSHTRTEIFGVRCLANLISEHCDGIEIIELPDTIQELPH